VEEAQKEESGSASSSSSDSETNAHNFGETPADLQQVVAFVQRLLQDSERLDRMSPIEHLRWARLLPKCSDPQAPEHLKLALARVLQLPAQEAQESRDAAIRHWEERKQVLDPEWAHLYRSLPEHVRSVLGPKKNLLILAELLAAAHHPDDLLIENLLQGFHLVGQLPRSGTLPHIPYAATSETARSLWDQRRERNPGVIGRTQRAKLPDTEMEQELLKKVQEEVDAGKATWQELTAARTKAVLTPRFVVDEGYKHNATSGAWKRKIRMIDDFLFSLVNAAASPGERIQHDHLDVLVALARQIGHGRIRFRKCDFANAFKTLPLRNEELFLAVATLLGENGEVWALQLLSCPFGAVGSVHAWHRFGAAIQSILANVFAVAYPRYVDDLFGVDLLDGQGPQETAELSRWVIEDLLGWELDADKGESNTAEFRALGVDVAVQEQEDKICFSIGEDKAASWIDKISLILHQQHLAPSDASKLAGKLSWGATAVFGRGARVYLAPLFFHAAGRTRSLSGRLKRALKWWLRYLNAIPIRFVSLSQIERRRLLLYTDATGNGIMAWVAEYGNQRHYASVMVSSRLRKWVCYRQNQIATWELVAAICGLWQFLEGPRQIEDGAEIHLFVDNNVALGTLLRGSSRQNDWNQLVTDIWFQTAARGFLLLCWRVPSKQNLADAPTRPEERTTELHQLRTAGFVQEQWQWPRQGPWE